MDQTIPAFANFPQDDQLWRLDVFGEYHRSEQVPSEPQIQIVLSPLVPEAAKWFGLDSPKAVSTKESQIHPIGIGYLPYVRRCTLWRNGALEDATGFGKLAVVEFPDVQISEGTVRILPASMKLGGKEYLIPPHQYFLGKIGLRTKLLAIDADGVENRILIDTTEAARMWYFNSASLAKALIRGHITPSDNDVFVEGSLEVGEGGTASIGLPRTMPRMDGWIAFRLAHSDYARKQALLIHNSLMREKINNKPVVPDVYPPFLGKTTLKTCGKWIMSGGEKRFLVHWIVSCSHPFPADELMVVKDGDDLSDIEYDRSLPRDPASRLSVPKHYIPNGETKFRSDREPKKPMRRSSILLSDARFSDLERKTMKRPSGEPVVHRTPRPAPIIEELDVKGLSTGDGTYGDTDVAPVSIGRTSSRVKDEKERDPVVRRPACSPSFDAVKNALAELEMQGNISIRYVSLAGDSDEECAENACLFPWQDEDGERIAWSIRYAQRRQALAAEIRRGGSYFYLFEAERHDDECYTTLFLHRHDLGALSDQMIQDVLLLCAKNTGKWFKDDDSKLHRIKIKHTWPTSGEFAQRLLKEMLGSLTHKGADKQRKTSDQKAKSQRDAQERAEG